MTGEWLEYTPLEKAQHLAAYVLEMLVDEAKDKERVERENELLRERIEELDPADEQAAA